MQPELSQDELRRTVDQLGVANDRMMQGESAPWKELLSKRDDVVLLGAFGGYIHDRTEVDARFDRTAQAYAGGHASFENLATWIGADLACTVDLERHHEQYLAGRGPMTITYRVTHVFRREPEGWKVIHRHADPLAEFRGPESVFPPAPPNP